MDLICIVCREVALPKRPTGRPAIYCESCRDEYKALYKKTFRSVQKNIAAAAQLTAAAKDLPYAQKAEELENLIVSIRPAMLLRMMLDERSKRWDFD